MNDGGLIQLIEMVKPIGYVIGAYFLFSAVRYFFKKQKENKN